MFKHLSLFILLGILSLNLKAQSKKEIRKEAPVYINLQAGANRGIYRDFATSPLFYKGLNFSLGVSRSRQAKERETVLGFNFTGFNYIATAPLEIVQSTAYTYSFYYRRLFAFAKNLPEKWTALYGGEIDATLIQRYSQALQNNASGFDGFFNLMGSVKLSRDVSRTQERKLKIWFYKKDLKPIKRTLSTQFNAGLLNTNLRNGYAYISNDVVSNDAQFFDGYKLHTFAGYRFQWLVNFAWHLNNQNKVSLYYKWDIMQSTAAVDIFQLANHQLGFALNFNCK